ncbi:MAG: DNA primase [Longimicrobiales bacterium]
MIPDTIVEDIRARADIVEIIGEQVPLKRAGQRYVGLCPFHAEKTPSFGVVPSKGFYKCFGCGESGDVFTFVMKRGGMTFSEAVRHLGARVGVEVPERERMQSEDHPFRELYEVIAFAADHFREQLWDLPAGEAGRRYLEARGISREIAERFGIGYAPGEWRLLSERAQRQGFSEARLLEAGLIKQSDRSEGPYDRFRERLIFPITEVSGSVVAFGGRAVGRPAEGVPKYLNSPETPIYHKGAILYGLSASKGAIRRVGSALVVEGYTDYVSLAAAGIGHVVAGMGTALTADQTNLLARYTHKVFLLYDSDIAGLRATFRSADALLRAGVHPLVVTLPPGEDPDSLVRKGGPDAVTALLDQAVDALEQKLRMLDDRGFFDDIDGSRRALDRLLPTLRATIDPTLRDIYVNRVAERTGVRPETLERELAASEHPGGFDGVLSIRRGRRRWSGIPDPGVTPRAMGDVDRAERLLLILMLRDQSLVGPVVAEIRPEDFRDATNRELFNALAADHESGGALGWEAALSVAVKARADEARRDPEEIADATRVLRDAVAEFEVRRLLLKHERLKNRRNDATDDELAEIIVEQQAVTAQLKSLGLGDRGNPRYRQPVRGARRSDATSTDEG